MNYYHRGIENYLKATLSQRPIVYINGPRQAGKSTLVAYLRDVFEKEGKETLYLTFDHYPVLMAANNDPLGFLKSLKGIVILDEVQLAPTIFRPLKQIIDEQRTVEHPTKFLLTGSVNVLSLPALSDALVGRMSVVTLFPFSLSEANKTPLPNILNWFETPTLSFQFDNSGASFSTSESIRKTTYPELVTHTDIDRYHWFEDYITTLLLRDIRNISEIEKGVEIPKMLRLLASRAANLLNDSNVANDMGIGLTTYRRYRSLLEQVFLITLLPPWFSNLGKRLVKSPKLFFMDTALLCHVLGIDNMSDQQLIQHPSYGHIIENWVLTELLKITSLSPIKVYHFRTQTQEEVDFVLERQDGSLLGIEVKGKSRIESKDCRGLRALARLVGDKLSKGIILHTGHDLYPVDTDFYAVPLSLFFKDTQWLNPLPPA
jgi:uncharacterized protein